MKHSEEYKIAELQVMRDLLATGINALSNPIITGFGIVLLAEYACRGLKGSGGGRWISADMKRVVQFGAIAAMASQSGIDPVQLVQLPITAATRLLGAARGSLPGAATKAGKVTRSVAGKLSGLRKKVPAEVTYSLS